MSGFGPGVARRGGEVRMGGWEGLCVWVWRGGGLGGLRCCGVRRAWFALDVRMLGFDGRRVGPWEWVPVWLDGNAIGLLMRGLCSQVRSTPFTHYIFAR